jgi:hypothetical protein
MRTAALIAASLTLVALDGCADDAGAQKPILGDCLVTLPTEPRFIPAERHGQSQADGFWHGNEALAVYLDIDGRWHKGFGEELFWYRQSRDWHDDRPSPELAVKAKRLDAEGGESPHISHTIPMWAGDLLTMMLTLTLPEGGCWQVTGNYKSDSLSFVVWVE